MNSSENSGTPKSSMLIGLSIINHPFWGTPNFWKHPHEHACWESWPARLCFTSAWIVWVAGACLTWHGKFVPVFRNTCGQILGLIFLVPLTKQYTAPMDSRDCGVLVLRKNASSDHWKGGFPKVGINKKPPIAILNSDCDLSNHPFHSWI